MKALKLYVHSMDLWMRLTQCYWEYRDVDSFGFPSLRECYTILRDGMTVPPSKKFTHQIMNLVAKRDCIQ